MTRAEQRANEFYPELNEQDDVVAWHGFIAGYEQAEKELALTWEDMRSIHEIICGIDAELSALPYGLGYQEYWEEILRRFKAIKEEENETK